MKKERKNIPEGLFLRPVPVESKTDHFEIPVCRINFLFYFIRDAYNLFYNTMYLE